MPKNPFQQARALHQLSFDVPREAVPALETLFEDEAFGVSSFEQPQDESQWRVQLLMETLPAEAVIRERLSRLESATGAAVAMPTSERIEDYDWVSAVQRDFAPLAIGRYFVHGSHVVPPKVGCVPLLIDAGAAFGSGEHATTSGCLLALHRLAKRKRFHRMLDMGCGSAILAIAMAKSWRCEAARRDVLAVDIDEVSVRVATGNVRDNGVAAYVRCYAGNGYQTVAVRQNAPYDLIVANILARPLVKMSGALARHLAPGGVAVLSGLLARQSRMVLHAHRMHGLILRERIARQGWHTLVLEKPLTD